MAWRWARGLGDCDYSGPFAPKARAARFAIAYGVSFATIIRSYYGEYMADAARQFFESLSDYSDLEGLISGGEAEGLYLECKSPLAPQLNRDLKDKLAKALSGFSNTAGGVIIWGISTTKHSQSGLDILTQLEPVGNCKLFAHQVEKTAPTLTTPSITTTETKVIHQQRGDSRGVAVTYIPKTLGDPVQSNIDNTFYFRSGDEFTAAPYEMVKRLFAATESPDLYPVFAATLIKLLPDGSWRTPIVVGNKSIAIAEHTKFTLSVINPSVCEGIGVEQFVDQSAVNPGERIFTMSPSGVFHRGFDTVIGTLVTKMKVGKRPKRILKLAVGLFANHMRARNVYVTIQLAKKGFSIVSTREEYLY